MNTILLDFVGSMKRIKNNFHFSFLAINYVNQGPFTQDIILPVSITQNILSFGSLNSFGDGDIQEYGNSIRRHFLNDMVIAYERYSLLMLASHNTGRVRTEPALLKDRCLHAYDFESVTNVYKPDDVNFLIQLRRLRNSIVHYNSVYSAANKLDYTFGTIKYDSMGNEGKYIEVSLDNLLWIYDKLMLTIKSGNARYFLQYPII